jgi:hypothetical protein
VIEATFWRSLRSAQGQRFRTSWPALLERLATPRIVADKYATPGFSLATFRDDRRGLANVEQVVAVGLDFDELGPDGWDDLLVRFAEVDAFLHTTHSHTPDAPRARAFLLLSRPVTGDDYRRVYAACCNVAADAGLVVDRQASDPSRFWFLPSVPPDGRFAFSIGRGRPVDVEGALRAVPPPRAPSVPPPPAGPVGDVEARAAAYLERCDGAVSGQGGHAQTFFVAQVLVRGFALDEATAYRLFARWNEQCSPPWKEWDLRRKLRQAATHGQMVEGSLRDRPRRAS